ncbi:MAG: Uma2 family endonuclease [Verrucomicrobia bacterium]|nr:Uma2 family endonuclease [Verrucomicrobiota bacterium]
MIVELFTEPKARRPFVKAFRPATRTDRNGSATTTPGEERIVLCGVNWKQYERLDNELGHDRPSPRLYWFDGQLEVMTTSLKHEQLKESLGALIEDYLLDVGIEAFPHGQATLKVLEEAGAEPDKSWCFEQEKEFPDLVLEVALSSGGIPKLDIYQRFGVPEVWLWRKDALEIWTLRSDKSGYAGPSRQSRLLRGLDVSLLERCLARPTWRGARSAFRQALRRRSR